jgi:hypothetical protein
MTRSANADPVLIAVSEALSRVRALYSDTQASGAAQTELAAIAGALQRALDVAGTTRSDAGQARFESELKLTQYGRRTPLIGSLLIQLWLREGAAILSDQGLAELIWLLETNSSGPSPRL